MNITSIRMGHATNSSSAHSIILHAFHDETVKKYLPGNSIKITETDYSRNRFVFRTRHDKAVYLLWSFKNQLAASNHDKISLFAFLEKADLLKEWEDAQTYAPKMEMSKPYKLDPPEDLQMSKFEWLEFLLSDAISIIGYDDNDQSPHAKLIKNNIAIDLDVITKWRRDGDAIVAFCKFNGSKFRASPTPYTKSTTPELVDLKITDHCTFACKFCYQNSTDNQNHAPLDRIEAIFDELANLGVFEVALGGGETPSHPDFAKILLAGHNRGLSVNFTSYGTEWADNKDTIEALKQIDNIGVGISVHTARDVQKIINLTNKLEDEHGLYGVNLIAQTVIGATSPKTILELIDICAPKSIPLLLLGYKNTGRGVSYKDKTVSADDVREILIKAKNLTETKDEWGYTTDFHLSVDTAFLDHWSDILDELKISELLRTSPEGKFSCYLNAVDDTIGPSSYAGEGAMLPRTDIKKQFALW